ncbi:alcohol dehydrogenase catalytic domain-containing protein [Geminicoccus flavidas]|uniref:alcohol dehydrogenase catalytic domain-containing protein n=1 Tax=Geminicoccus flavidas TaxID=2506407 RepID=UPI001356F9DE|nr:alcohol dehydrogenase catalytic domain-containing protein [Geminicoccus flavidas]
MTKHDLPDTTRFWPFAGGDLCDIGKNGGFVEVPLAPPGPDEVIARVDAACVCSSDIKVIRMGAAHPLFSERDLAKEPAVLGHEMALTVVAVGENWQGRYRPGDRLGLQPAITVAGRRHTIGMDLPGGFAQHIRLDARTLGGDEPYVFPVPDQPSAATIAMLEPYSCVEAAYRPNCRTEFKPDGRLLLVTGEGGDAVALDIAMPAKEATLVAADQAAVAWAAPAASVEHHPTLDRLLADTKGPGFDDIILRGRVRPELITALLDRLDRGGLLVLAGAQEQVLVAVDAARIHYHALSLLGTEGPGLADAFRPERCRFELKARGIALILGAGGAMGRIHLHRALEMADGPATILATSRKPARRQALEEDFGELARRNGRRLVILYDAEVPATVRELAPGGCDDVVVVAPDVGLIETGAGYLAPGGMLVLFSGMPFGKPCRLPLWRIGSDGVRFTGSSGSAVADQLAVLDRVMAGRLDLAGNLQAVGGLGALPDALEAVAEGRLSGKIAIYPGRLDLPLTPLGELRRDGSTGWSRDDEACLAAG